VIAKGKSSGQSLHEETFKNRVIRYVLERKCLSGGFCFYKLDEPNGSDTWFALSILDLLQVEFEDEATLAYLKARQHPDGSYDSVYSAYYSIKSLALLGIEPKEDPLPFIVENLGHYRFDARRLPAEVISLFKRTAFQVELYRTCGLDAGEDVRDHMIEFILRFQNEDGGFGHLRSTLHETALALKMLRQLDHPLDGLGSESFIRRCETPIHGFIDIPHTSMGYLEHVHAGLFAAHLISLRPTFLDHCRAFVCNCQKRSGGFSRTPQGGIATLEDTWLAVHSLQMLSSWIVQGTAVESR